MNKKQTKNDRKIVKPEDDLTGGIILIKRANNSELSERPKQDTPQQKLSSDFQKR